MRCFRPLVILFVATAVPAGARHAVSTCGTTRETPNETLFLHRQAVRVRQRTLSPKVVAAAPAASRDAGNIAIIEDSDGVVARQNEFNLDLKTLRFTPSGKQAAQYRYDVSDRGYDQDAADRGTPLAALDDDDSRPLQLPFAFPFYGATHSELFVNSDGNLTFTASDNASTDRSLARMTTGPPRISPLFDDLDPALTAGGVRVLSETARLVVTWVSVPEWQQSGIGARQTFQVRLYADGRIEFSYFGVRPGSAVVGIAPGKLQGSTSLVDFRSDTSGDYTGAVAERFGDTLEIDVLAAAQKFYQTHEDSYDYLVIYNNMDIVPCSGAVACEHTVRSFGTGFGSEPMDAGFQYGSPSRLQAVLNMGFLSEYPKDPNAPVPLRRTQGDTPLTTLAHETGHLFLAFVSVPDPQDPTAQPMLNPNNFVHWGFVFNSEASLLEGERIADQGAGASPRFITTDLAQGYSPLDQYLMGFAPPDPMAPTFWVGNAPRTLQGSLPLRGISFNGVRNDVTVQDIISVAGRRTPDDTVAQRRFRFAFILLVPAGTQPSAAEIAQVETYRQQFEPFFSKVSGGNAFADTTLARSVKLSLYPASGVVAGGTVTASLTVTTPPASDLNISLRAPNGVATVPASVKLPAGAKTVTFAINGVRSGVEELSAVPADPAYETSFARVQVADAKVLKLLPVSGDRQISNSTAPLPDPIVVRLTDANNLAYSGARVTAKPSGDGLVSPTAMVTDAQGQAEFRWTPGSASANQLQLAVEPFPSVALTLSAGSAVPVVASVVNAASFESGIAPGAFGTILGNRLAGGQSTTAPVTWPVDLAGVRVSLNGIPVPLLYASDGQINFYVPADTRTGAGTVSVTTPSGSVANATVEIKAVQPGIFPGAVLHAGTAISAVTTPVKAGEFIEIYCTGLGPTHTVKGLEQTLLQPIVFIGATPVQPVFSGLAPGVPGLYQVNVQVPNGLTPGVQSLLMSVNLAHSNQISIAVQ